MGLGVTLTTLQSGTEARAEDVNNDLAALNGASAPSFTTLAVTGASSLDSGLITSDGSGNLTPKFVNGPALQLAASATDQAAAVANYGGSGGAHGFLSFPYGGGTFTGHKAFNGTGQGTYTHGLSVTPDYVGITSTESNSSQTVGVDSLGSSTVHVNMPNAWPFVGVATKN